MAQNADQGTSGLNKFLTKKGLESTVSWRDDKSGPDDAPTWTSICKVGGQERGTGTGPKKHIARDEAANQALEALKAEEEQQDGV